MIYFTSKIININCLYQRFQFQFETNIKINQQDDSLPINIDNKNLGFEMHLISKAEKNDLPTILIPVLIACLLIKSDSFSIKMNMDIQSSDKVISSYHEDVGLCSCDLHVSVCDNFCCCDSTCSQAQIGTWTGGKLCNNNKNSLQTSCDSVLSGKGGYKSFQDLGCVYYSNRGNIGYFYTYPESGSINYPAPSKFVARSSQAQSIAILSSTAGVSQYSSAQYLLKISKDSVLKYLQIWSPIGGGGCSVGYVNISQSTSFTCQYALTNKSCLNSTGFFSGNVLLCKNGDCSSNESLVSPISPSVSGNTCNQMITRQFIDIQVSSSGQSYIINSINVSFVQGNISFSTHPRYPIKTTINIIKAANSTEYSGNPGYLMNKPVSLQSNSANFSLYNIADSSGNCVPTGIQQISIKFGQNAIYSCFSNDMCGNGLYADTIIKQSSIKIGKWARGSSQMISVSGIDPSYNSCQYQTITLNIIYSSAGWILDVQNYVIGSQLTLTKSNEGQWNRKYLKINWIYASPQTIASPPQNLFYSYFTYIWKPLRQYFGVY